MQEKLYGDVFFLLCFNAEHRLVCFELVLDSEDVLIPLYLGLDYGFVKEGEVYFNCIYRVMEEAVALKKTWAIFGQTSYLAKAYAGAVFEPLYLGILTNSTVLFYCLKWFRGLVFPSVTLPDVHPYDPKNIRTLTEQTNHFGLDIVPLTSKVVSTNYGPMACMYNRVTRLISRGANFRSQQWFLNYIQPHHRILSIGCGAVDFNVALSHFSPNVVALDISQQMIDCSKRMVEAKGTYPMEWVCTDIMGYVPERPFDVVLANYFFNTFRWEDCCKVLEYVTTMVAPNGVLCIADEAQAMTFLGKVLQRVCRPPLIGLHHLLAKHPFHSVYNYGPTLKSQGFLPVLTKQDVSDVVQSTIYKRSLL